MMGHNTCFKGVIWKLPLNYLFYPFLSGALLFLYSWLLSHRLIYHLTLPLSSRSNRNMKIQHLDRDTWRSGVRSAKCAASQLPARGPTVVDMAPVPAHKSKIRWWWWWTFACKDMTKTSYVSLITHWSCQCLFSHYGIRKTRRIYMF